MVVQDVLRAAGDIDIPFEYHESSPSNPTVVFFPGLLMRVATWQFLRDYGFSERFNYLVFEHRGQINATKFHHPDDEYSVEECCGHVEQIVAKLGLEDRPLHLVGVSTGALLALEYLIRNPGRTASLYLCGPYFQTFEMQLERNAMLAIGQLPEVDKGSYLDLFFYRFFSERLFTDRMEQRSVQVRRNLVVELFAQDPAFFPSMLKILKMYRIYGEGLNGHLDRIRHLPPTRLSVGSLDRTVSPQHIQKLAARMGASFHEAPGLGHAFFLEDVDHFLADVAHFVDGCIGRAVERRTQQRLRVNIPAELIDAEDASRRFSGTVIAIDGQGGVTFEFLDNRQQRKLLKALAGRDLKIQTPAAAMSWHGTLTWMREGPYATYIGVRPPE